MFKGNYRWCIVLLLFAVTIINYIDRSAIAFAAHLISEEFGLSASQMGLILGAFGVGYIISALFGGIAVDKFGARLGLTIVVLCWTLAIGWTGAAMGFVSLYAARIALGLAEGPSFPTTEVVVSRWLPPQERGTALAGALVAVPVALAIGAPLVSQLIQAFSWRTMFFILAGSGLAWLPLWWFAYRDSPRESGFVSTGEREFIEREISKESGATPAGTNWRVLLTTPTLWANYWAYFVFGYFLFFFMSWLPEFLRKTWHLDLSQVGYFSFLPWAVAAVLVLVFGRWSDSILRRTGSMRKATSYQIAGTQLVAALAVVPVTLVGELHVAIIAITVAVAMALAANAAYYAVVADLVPNLAGTAMGIMTIGFAAAGFLAPVITGYALELTGDFRPAFWLLSLLAGSSVLAVLLFHNPDRDRQRCMQQMSAP